MFAPSATGPGRCDRAARARVFAKCSAAPLEPDSTADFVEPSGHFSDEILEARLRLNGPRMTRMTRMSFGMTKRDCRMSKSESIQARVLRLEHCSSALARTTDQRLVRRSPLLRRSCCGGWIRGGGSPISDHTIRAGFTLLELLLVVGIIGLLLVLIAPAFTSIKSGSDFTNAVYGIQGLLESARTYAKANRTYVFVGFAEVDSSVDPSVSPQAAGFGRVAVAAVASKDGTRQFQYATSGQGSDWTANYSNGANLVAIGKLQKYENLHFLVDFPSWLPSAHPNSNMARFQPTGPPYSLGNAGSGSVTPFSWPVGSSLGSGQYNFTRVIYFDPTGIARIATSTNADTIAHVMEIDLQPTHGTIVPPVPSNQDVGNHAVIQLGTTDGAVRVYRP
jgi:prepilin-type N-terminal cleavage/methylation domain-containing protein